MLLHFHSRVHMETSLLVAIAAFVKSKKKKERDKYTCIAVLIIAVKAYSKLTVNIQCSVII